MSESPVQPTGVSIATPVCYLIVHNDDEHTFDYVVRALGKGLGVGRNIALLMATRIDTTGSVAIA